MNFSSEEFAVKSRKGDFGFWELNLGMGSPLGATRLAEQMGGKKKLMSFYKTARFFDFARPRRGSAQNDPSSPEKLPSSLKLRRT